MSHPPDTLPVAPYDGVVRPADVPVFRELLEGHGFDTTELSDVEIARKAEELIELLALMYRVVAGDW